MKSQQIKTAYQEIIFDINPFAPARWIEASMRLKYGTLGHLSLDDFHKEVKMFMSNINYTDREQVQTWEALAKSYAL